MRVMRGVSLLWLSLVWVAVARAAPSADSIQVTKAWARATAAGVPVGVVYFEIDNSGPEDELIAIESRSARRVEMHSMAVVDGQMRMRPVPRVPVPAAGRVVFEPGGLHAMLIDLKAPLEAGERIALTCTFRHFGRIRVEALVQGLPPADAAGAAPARAHASAYRLAVWPTQAVTPHFDLVDLAGRPRALTDYRGKLLVVFFGFTRCPDACPAELLKLALALRRLGRSSDRVQVVFITLDPERDTNRILKNYVTAFDARFAALTGSASQIDAAARSFLVQYAKVPAGDDYTIDHSTGTFVFDAAGHLRLVGTLQTSVEDWAHDLKALASE
jgi:protein SCO1/2